MPGIPNRAPQTLVRRVRELASQGQSPLADRELLRRFATEHDESAFNAIVRRHGPMVLDLCRRMLADLHAAEDVFQATFPILSGTLRAVSGKGCKRIDHSMELVDGTRVGSARKGCQLPKRHPWLPTVSPKPFGLISARTGSAVYFGSVLRLSR